MIGESDVMDITEKRKVEQEEEVVIGKKCDYCGAEIKPWQLVHDGFYFEITTGHHDWGNDSHESLEHTDACSIKCLQKAMNTYYKTTRFTDYIEIEKYRKI